MEKPVSSVCECGQLQVIGIYHGKIACPVCNGTPRQPLHVVTEADDGDE